MGRRDVLRGGYEASFGAVKQGGKNFIQAAKVTFEIGVSSKLVWLIYFLKRKPVLHGAGERATARWDDHGRQPDSGAEADGPAATRGGAAEGQDGQPDVSRAAAGRPAADEFRAADVHDELAASGGNPGYGPLFQAALGGAPLRSPAGRVASSTAGGRLGFAAPHGLGAGQAVSCGGEIRFVAAIVDASTVQLNAPFTVLPATGAAVAPTVTYVPATELPSVSIFDYWDPATAVQRLLCGAAVDQMEILVNGDYHEFHFSGLAQDVLDSSSFSSANVGTACRAFRRSRRGRVRLFDCAGEHGPGVAGNIAIAVPHDHQRIHRSQEPTGHAVQGVRIEPAARISPGQRTVTAAFELFSQDDAATKGLYQAARQQSPISVMFQLGANRRDR